MKFSSSIKKVIKILLFLQLFIIPSHVFSKNLSGVKLFCNIEQLDEDEEKTYRLFDFIDNEKVDYYYIAKTGIKKITSNYFVDVAYVKIQKNNSSLNLIIDRKTLTDINKNIFCNIEEFENTEIFLNTFFFNEFESKNKI